MISKDKQYRTRDGREVRIYATDGWGDYPVQGAIGEADGWILQAWRSNGKSGEGISERRADLIEVKPRIKREYWLVLYNDGEVCSYRTEELAKNAMFKSNRIACVKVVIDCEEGEGL